MLAFLRRHAARLPWPAFALISILFYSVPLFSRNATIHWDLADVTYPAQKFFAEALRTWKLPHWTPYLDSGIPFLADPHTGAWYPLHWPFFLLGVTPRGMFWELALHAFIAMGGAYLLALLLFQARGAAMVGGALYGLSGFFAAHSSALPAFEAAAWLPWLVWAALNALRTGGRRWTALAALAGGLIVLTGDLPSMMESLLTLVCVAPFGVAGTRKWGGAALSTVTIVVLAAMLGGAAIVPSIELHAQSHPAASAARFHISALGTMVAPDYFSLINGLYSGPEDPRQHYLYEGLLLLPLAISGFARKEKWRILLALMAPTILFDAALRPPGDAWFPASLAFAMTAASGTIWIETRMERPHLWAALLVLSLIDVWFWNLYKNPLVFARASFAELYGQPQREIPQWPLERTWAPYPPLGVAPADGPLITHDEVTYGYGIAELGRYKAYSALIEKNPKLLNGLAVTELNFGRNRVVANPDSLGRVSVPPRVEFVASSAAAAAALAMLNPAESAIAEGPERRVSQKVDSVTIAGYTGDSYRIKYSASGDSLLRIAVPYYPGWTAEVDGTAADVIPVDEALMGVVVPPGSHELTLQFVSRRFSLGVSLSAAAAIALVIGLILT